MSGGGSTFWAGGKQHTRKHAVISPPKKNAITIKKIKQIKKKINKRDGSKPRWPLSFPISWRVYERMATIVWEEDFIRVFQSGGKIIKQPTKQKGERQRQRIEGKSNRNPSIEQRWERIDDGTRQLGGESNHLPKPIDVTAAVRTRKILANGYLFPVLSKLIWDEPHDPGLLTLLFSLAIEDSYRNEKSKCLGVDDTWMVRHGSKEDPGQGV